MLVGDHGGEVGVVVGVDDGLGAGGHVDLDEAEAVGAGGGCQPDSGAGRGDSGHGRPPRHREGQVFEGVGAQGVEALVLAGADHQVDVAGGSDGQGGADPSSGVGQPGVDRARVLGDQHPLAGVQVHPPGVEAVGRAGVEGHDRARRVARGQGEQLRLHPSHRREVAWRRGGGVAEVDDEEVEVLVAARVLEVQDVAAVGGPPEGADSPSVVVGHAGVMGGAPTQHADPHVEAIAFRAQVGEAGAVWSQAGRGPSGVGEQGAERYQRRRHRVRTAAAGARAIEPQPLRWFVHHVGHVWLPDSLSGDLRHGSRHLAANTVPLPRAALGAGRGVGDVRVCRIPQNRR